MKIKKTMMLLLCAALLLAPALSLAAGFTGGGLTLSSAPQQLGTPEAGSASVTVSVPGEHPAVSGVKPIPGEPYRGA